MDSRGFWFDFCNLAYFFASATQENEYFIVFRTMIRQNNTNCSSESTFDSFCKGRRFSPDFMHESYIYSQVLLLIICLLSLCCSITQLHIFIDTYMSCSFSPRSPTRDRTKTTNSQLHFRIGHRCNLNSIDLSLIFPGNLASVSATPILGPVFIKNEFRKAVICFMRLSLLPDKNKLFKVQVY